MLTLADSRCFTNGVVYLMHTHDGYPIEVTDTFLPYYTKNAIGRHQNNLISDTIGDRTERWMIGVSVMSGCPVACKFCATGKLSRWRRLSAEEMVAQVEFIIENNPNVSPHEAKEFKINWTRMGEPFLNIKEVRKAMAIISSKYPNAHHYISTIGVKGADYSWIKGNTTLQFSIHSFDESYRDWLIPYKGKVSLDDIGKVRTLSNLKTTLNLTMAREEDFDINKLKKLFDKDSFFIKISPINGNDIATSNGLDDGIIKQQNFI